MLTDTHTRITVQVPGHTVDLTLTKQSTVAALLLEVVPYLRDALAHHEDSAQWLGDRAAIWQLTTVLGQHLPAGSTLSELNIADGAVLVLSKSDQRETYPPLIDDVAESIAFAQRDMASWTSSAARNLASIVAPLVAASGVAILVYAAWTGIFGVGAQLIACGVLALTAAGAIVGGAFGLRAVTDPSTRQLAAAVILVGYICVAGAGVLVIPGEVSVLSVLTTAAITATVAVIGLVSIGYPPRLHYTVATLGVLVLVAGLLMLATEDDPLVFAVFLGATALLFLLFAPRLSLVLAGIPMPFVPTMGETFVHDDSDDITTVESGSGSAAITAIINQEKQVQDAYQCNIGLTWGALSAIGVSAIVAGMSMHHHHSAAMAFYIVLTIAMLFRGKSFEDAVLSRSWLIGAATSYVAFVLTVAVANDNYLYALIGLGVLTAGTVAACYVALREKVVNSPIVMKLLEILESISFATPIVLIVLILDGYNKVRGR